MDEFLEAERVALATLVVRGRAWLEARAAGHDTRPAAADIDAAMREFRKCERALKRAAKRARNQGA